MNAYINTKIEMRTLTFHTTNDKGLSKCHQLHIGKSSKQCPELKVHNTKMEETKEKLYLGDLLMTNGKNASNISNRVSKAVGIVSNIFDILKNIWNSHHYFKTALLLRDSMLISSVLSSAEVWHNLTKTDIKELTKVDKLFFQTLMETPFSLPGIS